MSESVRWNGRMPDTGGRAQQQPARPDGTNLADILERVLDKGIVIAGDVQINLLDIELLTIKLRLVVASVDRAKEMGIDWWERDPTLSSGRSELEDENRRLRRRLEAVEGPEALAEFDDESDDEFDGDHDDDPDDDLGDDDVDEAEIEVDGVEDEEPEEEPPPPPRRRRREARREPGRRSS